MSQNKGIVLTKEEIEKLNAGAHRQLSCIGCDIIAKEAVKKVVELLEDDYVFDHDIKTWGAEGRECKEGCCGCAIWQALLKAIE